MNPSAISHSVSAAINANPISMSSREIADLCDKRHTHVMDDCRKLAEFYTETYSAEKSAEYIRESTYTDSIGRTLPCFELSKQASLDLVTGYSLPHRHAVNKRWQELEIQAAQPPVPKPNPTRDHLDACILLLRSAAEDLKFSPSSILGGYQRLEQHLGMRGLLPGYAVDAPVSAVAGSSEVTKSASELLKEFGVNLSVIAFNQLLMQHGFLDERERPSSKGSVKKFKVCTNLEYGKNITSPNNPRETQPHWYASKFPKLLGLVAPGKFMVNGAEEVAKI